MVKREKEGGPPRRQDLPSKDKWKLELMYENRQAWEKDFLAVGELLPRLEGMKGTLSQSSSSLLACLQLQDQLGTLVEKLYAYAKMRRDEDNSDSVHQEMADRALGLAARAGAAAAFIKPEILQLEAEVIRNFLEDGSLALYRHFLDDTVRLREHLLSAREEELLSLAGEVLEAPENIFSLMMGADLTFPAITGEKGEKITVTSGRFVPLLLSRERRVRQEAFTSFFSTLEKFQNTFSASLGAAVKKNLFLSRARKYPSSLDFYLDGDHIPTGVYRNVVDTINENLEPLHRYTTLKKKILGLDRVEFYDLYVPLAGEGGGRKYSFEEARKVVLEALVPLGQEYLAIVEEAFRAGWIDVYENKGKTSGAYSFGTYESPPFILMNFNGTLNDIFTLAHELGHSLHSYYTSREQPFIYSRYTIFSAEVASTTNEALLVRHLLKVSPPGERAVILNQYLEGIRGTFFRQTLFAEFELKIHSLAEKGEALTAQKLGALWLELNRRYYGPSFHATPLLKMEWARIPHFYYNFYVYKYVTGYAAGTSLARKILGEGKETTKRYMNFLKKGNAGYSLNILEEAGVNMQEPGPLRDTVDVFALHLEELEALLTVNDKE